MRCFFAFAAFRHKCRLLPPLRAVPLSDVTADADDDAAMLR